MDKGALAGFEFFKKTLTFMGQKNFNKMLGKITKHYI